LKRVWLSLFLALGLLSPSISWAQDGAVPDIKDIPRLRAGLAPGTVAWATLDQLHPTQPQVGMREVLRKAKRITELLKDGGKKFSKELYQRMYRKGIAPVYIGQTPASDSRYGTQRALGYNTDRTHSTHALAKVIKEVYGKKALSEPIYDEKGRPLNFVLVKVMADQSQMSEKEFAEWMVANKDCYLENFIFKKNGDTEIEKIAFSQLPEKVYETTDNPFRGLIGEMQNQDMLAKSEQDFSEFEKAEALVRNNVVRWPQIDENASEKEYAAAEKDADRYLRSAAGSCGGVY